MALRQVDPFDSRVRVVVTDRCVGSSRGPYAAFNLGDHVGDRPSDVVANRVRLERLLGRPVQWAKQVHGSRVVDIEAAGEAPVADGLVTDRPGIALGILTADCFPVVLATPSKVAILHCGWQGASNGLIENTLAKLRDAADEPLAAWVGPGICGDCYEVDEPLWKRLDDDDCASIRPGRDGHGFLDIRKMIERRLPDATTVAADARCTFETPRLFSHRRHSKERGATSGGPVATGRFATLVWLEAPDRSG